MPKCLVCGAESPDESKFCGGCGKQLPSGSTAAVSRCHSCNAEITQGTKFCGNCGAQVTADTTGETARGALTCPRCGTKNIEDAMFCAACGGGLRQPIPTIIGDGPGAGLPASQYLSLLDARMTTSGFEPFGNSPILSLDRSFRRKKFELLQVGMVTTFCAVKCVDYLSDAKLVETFNKAAFDHALRNKGFFARNAFQSLLVYQVVVASGSAPEIQRFLDSYWPKHWMAYEFSVVIDLSANRMLCHGGTPIWGLAFHQGFKKEAMSLFSPG